MLPSARSVENNWLLRSVGPRHGLATLAIVVASWLSLTADNGAEQVSSGWAVGTPATAILDAPPPDPELHGILYRVLQQADQPILRDGGPSLSPPEKRDLQGAQPPTVDDGWRRSGLWTAERMISNPIHVGQQSASLAGPGSQLDASTSTPTGTTRQRDNRVAENAGRVAVPENSPIPLRPPEPADDTPATADEGAGDDADSAPSEASANAQVADDEAELEFGAQPDDSANETSSSGEAPDTSESPGLDGSPADEPSAAEPAEDSLDEGTSGESSADSPSGTENSASTQPPAEATNPNPSDGDSRSVPAVPEQLVVKPSPPPLTRQLMNLRSRVRSVLRGYYRKPLNSREHDTWEAMHGMLAYGIHSRILQGSPRGTPITSVGWLCYNKPCKGLTLLYVTPQGELRAKWGVGLQGHSGQFLAMLAQCHVSPDYPIHVGKREFRIGDLIEAEKKTCYPKSELTFKLIALQHYLDLNEQWVNDQGTQWDIPRLIREEISQPIRGAACGGTHRLSGLSLTVKARLRRGEPLDGEYARAAEFVEKYEQYAFRLQNRDGSLSTEWFRGRGDDDDLDRRIKTTGHILEWLCYTLSDEELRQPRTVRAVWYLASLMYSNYDHEWEVGPRSHATHALLLYDERVFGPFDAEGVVSFKSTPSTANRSQRRTSSRR